MTAGASRLIPPVRRPRASDAELPPFPAAGSAAPLPVGTLREGSCERRAIHEHATGETVLERIMDEGEVRHPHTGLVLTSRNEDRFLIHPDDPSSARGRCRWSESFARDGWRASAETEVEALDRAFRMGVKLVTTDADGGVHRQEWDETIPRDLA